MKGKASLARCPLSPICFLNLYRWFWNHIFTCVGERFISRANCSRSGAERYRCCLKRLSSSKICALENSTLRFRFLVLGISVSGSFSFSLLKSSTSSLSVESAKIKGIKMLKTEMTIDELKNRMQERGTLTQIFRTLREFYFARCISCVITLSCWVCLCVSCKIQNMKIFFYM